MTHTPTFHSIQNIKLRHHHVGRGIGPCAPAHPPSPAYANAHANTPAHANAPAHSNAIAPAPAKSGCMCHPKMVNAIRHWALTCIAFVCMSHTPTLMVLCGGLYKCHAQNNKPTRAESFHG
ncbi:hypothetical protein O181_074618 [Austropuccinia psidii MF-1]|uniref:Uncharacterized protein n=1 Tax=Austropuccinia psidii MF-1 TaxID=1389203 RepID=A0A9Q3F792_9BASI|nr:hypothetical protein [Austropuccinia psidii MF-1]